MSFILVYGNAPGHIIMIIVLLKVMCRWRLFNIWRKANRATILWFGSEQKLTIIGDLFTKKIFMLIELTSNESIIKSQKALQKIIIFDFICESSWFPFAFLSFLWNVERFALLYHIEWFQLAHTRLLPWLNCLQHKVIRNYWLILTKIQWNIHFTNEFQFSSENYLGDLFAHFGLFTFWHSGRINLRMAFHGIV